MHNRDFFHTILGTASRVEDMDSETVAKVAEQYPWSSWAVWDDAFPNGDCVEERPGELVGFVCDHVEVLTRRSFYLV